MQRSMLVMAAILAVAVQGLGQGRPADVPAGQPLNDPERLAPLEPLPTGRQPGWIDENAMPAGSQLPAPSAVAPANALELREQISPSAPEIRTYVASLTNAALSAEGFRKASEMLSEEDRQRLQKDLRDEDARAYDELVQRFRSQWKSRYGEEFDLTKQRGVMAQYYVLRGPQPNDPITVGSEVPPRPDRPSATPRANGQQGAPSPASAERVATMIVPSNTETQQPAMLLQFRNETAGQPGKWKLATPQSLTGHRLRENLTQRMEKMLDGQAKWPADPREAYRLMGYHVLASMADQPPDRPQQDRQQKQVSPDNPSLES